MLRVAAAIGIIVAVCVAGMPDVACALDPGGPEDTLMKYLGALKAEKFEDAWPLVSKAMKGGRDFDAWVKDSKEFMRFADVKIFSFNVGKAKVQGDTAEVPNVLESQDRFANTLGLTEYELYTLIREDGAWKVDSQLLLEPSEVPKWFPDAAKKPDAGASH